MPARGGQAREGLAGLWESQLLFSILAKESCGTGGSGCFLVPCPRQGPSYVEVAVIRKALARMGLYGAVPFPTSLGGSCHHPLQAGDSFE